MADCAWAHGRQTLARALSEFESEAVLVLREAREVVEAMGNALVRPDEIVIGDMAGNESATP